MLIGQLKRRIFKPMKKNKDEDQEYTEFSLDNEPSMDTISEMNLNELRKTLKQVGILIKGTK